MEAMKDVEKYYRENPNMTGEQKLDMALEIIKESSASLNVTISDKEIDDLIAIGYKGKGKVKIQITSDGSIFIFDRYVFSFVVI